VNETWPTLLVFAAMISLVAPARASNVDLSTVPKRDAVQLTIYNSEDLTLVRETRKVTFKKGQNPLQFSWANTLIDPTSVELRFLSPADKLEVLDTTFPHDKPQMLYWNVQSEIDGEATIEITYFTSGITWSADYIAIASRDETNLALEGFVRVTNNSGEEYEDAEIRLVVGTINLVEKIAQLARIPVSQVDNLQRNQLTRLRDDAAKDAMELDRGTFGGGGGRRRGAEDTKEKQIIKEGLSEYFIYSIEGTETIANGWSKRMRSFEGTSVPFKIQYRYRPQEYGEQLVRMYLLTNDKPSKLGTTPLPNGTVRVFRDNGRDGLSYLAAQTIKYIPIGDKIELNLGADPEVVFDLVKLKTWRDEIWMRLNGGDVFVRANDGALRVEVNSSVAGWDEHQLFSQRIRNYSAKPIDVEIRRSFDGHAVFRSLLDPVLHDYMTVQLQTTVEAGRSGDLRYELLTHQGRNSRQNNVILEKAELAR
jgi:hypothetical protein